MMLSVTLVLLSMAACGLGQEEQQCKPNRCFDLDYESLAMKYYKGMFVTKETIMMRDREWREKKKAKCLQTVPFVESSFMSATFRRRSRRKVACQPDDHDRCCPTQLAHSCERTLINTSGQLKTILHFDFLEPPLYQWYPNATCGESGSCSGTCRIEKITIYLLAYSLGGGWPFAFDSFEVNGYCSCKSH